MQDKLSYIEIVKEGVSAVHLPTEEADLTQNLFMYITIQEILNMNRYLVLVSEMSLLTLNVDANNELKQFEKEKRKSMCKWMKRKRIRMRMSKV